MKKLILEDGVTFVGKGDGKIVVGVESESVEVKIPAVYNGLPIETKVTGKIYALGELEAQEVSPEDRQKKWRPAPGGVSIGHYAITAGTLGSLFRRKGSFPITTYWRILTMLKLETQFISLALMMVAVLTTHWGY